MLDTFYVDNKDKFLNLEKEIDLLNQEEGSLIVIMQKAQELFGYLPIEVQVFIGEKVNVPLPDIYGVATFYSQFNLEKQGLNKIGVCQGTACYVKGSRKIQDEIEKELGITDGETSSNNIFTLNETRCVGACGLAPVVMINDDAHGRLMAKDVKDILDKYQTLEDL